MPLQRNEPGRGLQAVPAIVHADKRSNIPTADNAVLLEESDTAPRRFPVTQGPVTDPQLVWRGKEADRPARLEVNAPPVFIQEKIDPRALVEAVRSSARNGYEQPALYKDFDGLEGMQAIEFYQHPQNWSNRMILGDSLTVMASLAEREVPSVRGKVQMVYMDPPYGIRFGSNWQPRTSQRDVMDTRTSDVTREVEQIKAFRDTWQWGLNSFLSYLRDRLFVARELLSESGTLFLQIGDDNLHLVRALLDEVFGRQNFCSQISFRTTSSATGELLGGTVDYLLWYAKDRAAFKEHQKYRQLYRPKQLGGDGSTAYRYIELADGTRRPMTPLERRGLVDLPSGGRAYTLDNLTSQSVGQRKGEGTACWFPVDFDGRTFKPPEHSAWKTNKAGMDRLKAARRLGVAGNTLRYVRYFDDFPAYPINNTWDDTTTAGFGDPKLYVVQTNTKVVERCILMSTDPGDLVLDPTCGSGTTACAAERWGRRWITIDTSRVALALARQRLMTAKYPYFLLADSPAGQAEEARLAGTPRQSQQTHDDIRKGFVCKRHRHLQLKTYATNPHIRPGMTRAQIEEVVLPDAEQQLLYDQPVEDRKKIRVTGRFTVESLSPYRTLSADADLTSAVQTADASSTVSSYEQGILDHLLKEGVGTGDPAKRIRFDTLVPYPDKWIHAEGLREHGPDGRPQRIAVFIGPQYGTVGPGQIRHAARSALRGAGFNLLIVCGFAFAPDTPRTTEEFRVSSLPVLPVRMNSDLAMGQSLLKNTGTGNLFTLFGEPDIEIAEHPGDLLTVEVKGVDVYDPTTNLIRSRSTENIALWMIDTEYDEESFFVRHCYFTGAGDPYHALRRALHTEIDESAWLSCYGKRSRPFPRPAGGRIAVKVINDYGDEVLKVYDVRSARTGGQAR